MKRGEGLELTLEDCFQKTAGTGALRGLSPPRRGGRTGHGRRGEGSCHSHRQKGVSGKMSSAAMNASDEDGKNSLGFSHMAAG